MNNSDSFLSSLPESKVWFSSFMCAIHNRVVNYGMHVSLPGIYSLAYSLQIPRTEQRARSWIPGEFWVHTANHFLLLIPRGRKSRYYYYSLFLYKALFISSKNRAMHSFRTELPACSFPFKLPSLTIRKCLFKKQYIIVFPYQFDLLFCQ